MNMLPLNPELWIILTGLMLWAYWAVYCMGSPLADKPSDIDIGGIFFFIPLLFATNRLMRVGKWREIHHNHIEALQHTSDVETRNGMRKDYRRELMTRGREFFTWERSLLCPICLHWWLTVVFVIVAALKGALTPPIIVEIAVAYLVNHLIIRKIA